MDLPTNLVFHPGRFSKKTREEKKKETRRKAREIIKKKERQVYNNYLNNNKIETFSFKGPSRAWWTPPSFKGSAWAAFQFDLIAVGGYNGLLAKIRLLKANPTFSITGSTWIPPPEVQHAIKLFHVQREMELRQVAAIYRLFLKAYIVLKPFLVFWRRKRYMKNLKNTEDIVTLESPKNPVYIVDLVGRCAYVFEAKTLKNTFEIKFLLSDYMFPEPEAPCNPLTNQMLTVGQLISCIEQMQGHGVFSWILDRYRKGGFSMIKFERSFRQYLKMKAIAYHFDYQVEDSMETVVDYFQLHAEDAEMADDIIERFIFYMKKNTRTKTVRNWRTLVKQYYIAKELNETTTLALIIKRTDEYIQHAYYVVN